eukprot:CAMPEP_0119415504 /NCGR_PEP_ID=MMETSP1335-20130426/9360_1 /TAXON_ID=259385 /ORGANISM="Chrysoculter rhomboideus, Strain RCC1486" /LENGTH=51 /DNA_ID=CAMNT_0007440507 /DNA_START=92 /DNA_END=243 /DNA_ORIENTATION=+
MPHAELSSAPRPLAVARGLHGLVERLALLLGHQLLPPTAVADPLPHLPLLV